MTAYTKIYTPKEKKIIKEAIKVLKKGGKRCKEYQPYCFNCIQWRLIDDLESLSEM